LELKNAKKKPDLYLNISKNINQVLPSDPLGMYVYIYIWAWVFPKMVVIPPKWMVKIMENPAKNG